MDETNIQKIKHKWGELLRQLNDIFGEKPDLQGLIFLIGVQELGKGPQNFSKDEKQDLMHIATCRLLSFEGYYEFTGLDDDGWPQYEIVKHPPQMSLKDQDLMLKKNVIQYFELQGFNLENQPI
ncbi:MAG: hypothetical protein BWX95_01751 [Bacteroidetes bacterium ADurb.Bin141]|nr:MAG: hypothetical protein UZ10_BCD003001506 [Bacteroidetes bacterium OLB10]MBV6454651.1 hypothetical protein [Bacteroidia bacterium]MBX3106748.1 hypothetical protein [Bacteroidota bacterium]OQB61717.1 MAG: hypothetical protein BWX95_01751 [Bacteroidetes bacterium ADurb.Bin141]MCB0848671.1 hypothetical protein [Bacteroidota bacterium]